MLNYNVIHISNPLINMYLDKELDAAFHQGLHYLLEQIDLLRKKSFFFRNSITCDPSINTMEHFKFIVSNQKEESTSA